jgi:transcriptional regulator with XRE-family HTH domain
MPKRIDAADLRVGQRVRAYRLSRGMSQSALGEKVGVTFQQIQKYENGVNRIGSGRLQKIAAVLDAPVSAFFGQEGKDGDSTVDRVLTEALSRPYAVRLLWAFDAVKSSDLRRALVELVESVGATGKFGGLGNK